MLIDDLKAQLAEVSAKFDSYVAANGVGIAIGLAAIAQDKIDSGRVAELEAAEAELKATQAQLGDLGTGLSTLDAKIADALAAEPQNVDPATPLVPNDPIALSGPIPEDPKPTLTVVE